MRGILLLMVVGAACSGSSAVPDADNRISECFQERGCENGKALDIPSTVVPNDLWTTSFCEENFSHPCTSGCALESVGPGVDLGGDIDPAIFCAETPAAKEGDPCNLGCLPTRAMVDASGVVTQAYLGCDQSNYRCVAAPPPTVASWMAPCPMAVATWGKPGVNGAVSSDDPGECCVLVWDAQAGTVASGATITCLGDWDCPAGAMCDDQVPSLDDPGNTRGLPSRRTRHADRSVDAAPVASALRIRHICPHAA